MMLLQTADFDIWKYLYDSPVLIALITAAALQIGGLLVRRFELVGAERKDTQEKLWAKIESLEKKNEALDRRNDEMVQRHADDKADMNSRVKQLEAQVGRQNEELRETRYERDDLRAKLSEANDRVHRTLLEMEVANTRIKQLEQHTAALEERLKATETDR
jgi:chromosome segregation ATPase